MMVKIYLGSDHAGYEAKQYAKKILERLGIYYEDIGNFENENCDYPNIARQVSRAVLLHEGSMGILICGSGTGMSIAANRVKGIRAAFCFDEYSAVMARRDNNCNVLTLRAREFDIKQYYKIIKAFVNEEFSGEERHERRIWMIDEDI